jgi:adenosylmethionine-8-amino-7-oxononanoate aminotransferase
MEKELDSLPMVELSKKLEKLMPGNLSAFFYVNSGSEANETALKIARSYHLQRGEPERVKIISRYGSYHGTTLGVTAATGLSYFTEPYQPMIPDYYIKAVGANCSHCHLGLKKETCSMDCFTALQKVIEDNDPKTISALIMDPIPGSNTGYPIPPEGYMQKVRELCDKYGIILIFDEIQTGIGKSGYMFASEYLGVTPDIMTLSKAITNGYIPLGVVAMRQDIYDLFRSAPGRELRSGSTFGGHNVACAAAIACLDYIEEYKLLDNVKVISNCIKERVAKLMDKYPIIAAIHGVGLLLAIELAADRKDLTPLNPEYKVGSFINEYCYEHGLIMRNNGDIIVIAPPLTFKKEHVDIMMDTFENAVKEAIKKFNL